jgi:hypothetical protein
VLRRGPCREGGGGGRTVVRGRGRTRRCRPTESVKAVARPGAGVYLASFYRLACCSRRLSGPLLHRLCQPHTPPAVAAPARWPCRARAPVSSRDLGGRAGAGAHLSVPVAVSARWRSCSALALSSRRSPPAGRARLKSLRVPRPGHRARGRCNPPLQADPEGRTCGGSSGRRCFCSFVLPSVSPLGA